MTNGELRKILQSFPEDGTVHVRRQGDSVLLPIEQAEMTFAQGGLAVGQAPAAWTDLAKDRVQLVLVTGTAPERGSEGKPAGWQKA